MTRHPCGCGIAWLPHGGPQDPAETRAPPVFQRLSTTSRPGWLLCSGHLRLLGLPADLRDPRRSRLPESVMRAHMRRLRRGDPWMDRPFTKKEAAAFRDMDKVWANAEPF